MQKFLQKALVFMTTVVLKAFSGGLQVPGGAVELGGPTTSRAQMLKILSILIGLSQ